MRVLSNLTALATVDLVVTEIKDYVAEEAVTYRTGCAAPSRRPSEH